MSSPFIQPNFNFFKCTSGLIVRQKFLHGLGFGYGYGYGYGYTVSEQRVGGEPREGAASSSIPMDVYSWFRRSLSSSKRNSTPSSSVTTAAVTKNSGLKGDEIRFYGITDQLIEFVKSFSLDTFKSFSLPGISFSYWYLITCVQILGFDNFVTFGNFVCLQIKTKMLVMGVLVIGPIQA